MEILDLHRWDLTPREARLVQEELREQTRTGGGESRLRFDEPISRIAGVDVHVRRRDGAALAVVAVLEYPGLRLVEHVAAAVPLTFPYVPGLLSFRETPAVLEALRGLEVPPDLLLCDGQGYAHPRRFGLACHVGLVSGIPSIGAAKSRLLGTHGPVPAERGGRVPLEHEGEVVGVVLRTRGSVKPLYVSTGHRVDLETAVAYVLACCPRFRVPEPVRRAHALSREYASGGLRLPSDPPPPAERESRGK